MLARTQETLLGFQADLGGISDEIRHLQQQSLKMGVQLRNRRAAESRVSAFLERLVLPPGAARHLCDGEVRPTRARRAKSGPRPRILRETAARDLTPPSRPAPPPAPTRSATCTSST